MIEEWIHQAVVGFGWEVTRRARVRFENEVCVVFLCGGCSAEAAQELRSWLNDFGRDLHEFLSPSFGLSYRCTLGSGVGLSQVELDWGFLMVASLHTGCEIGGEFEDMCGYDGEKWERMERAVDGKLREVGAGFELDTVSNGIGNSVPGPLGYGMESRSKLRRVEEERNGKSRCRASFVF